MPDTQTHRHTDAQTEGTESWKYARLPEDPRLTAKRAWCATRCGEGHPTAMARSFQFLPQKTAPVIARTLEVAVAANAENNYDLDPNALYVKFIFVDDGPQMKRGEFRGAGASIGSSSGATSPWSSKSASSAAAPPGGSAARHPAARRHRRQSRPPLRAVPRRARRWRATQPRAMRRLKRRGGEWDGKSTRSASGSAMCMAGSRTGSAGATTPSCCTRT
ncbi:MAG: uL22 family ribosomal protein [Thermomicrobiales bacterium]